MSDLSELYGIDVTAWVEYDPEWGCTRSEWDADPHRRLLFKPTAIGRQRPEVVAAHRWAVGVMAQAALDLTDMVSRAARGDWPAPDRRPTCVCCGHTSVGTALRSVCGDVGHDFDDAPTIEVTVPAPYLKYWITYARERVARYIVEDLGATAPTSVPQAPSHQSIVPGAIPTLQKPRTRGATHQ